MFTTYLQQRNGKYHLRVRTPVDLLGIIPQSEILKSLKTASLRTAKASALPYLQAIRQTATLLRLRYITSEQAQDNLNNLLNWKPRAVVTTEFTEPLKTDKDIHMLSKVIKDYIDDKEREWTPRTLMEATGILKLMVDLLGDVPIESITRETARNLKNQFLKLPPNVSKLYPNQSPLKVLKMIGSGKIIVNTPLSLTTVNKHISWFSTLVSR